MSIKLDTALVATSLPAIPEAAKAAEDAGFDCLWTADTGHDPFLPITLAAEHTQRVKLGTAIAVAFPRSPMVTAMIAWDLAELSGGRFLLGLGTQVKGHIERRFSVKWEAPGPRMRDYILALRAIWDCWQNGSPLRFESKHYRHTLMTPFFAPAPMEHWRIPVYIAGVNEYMCRLAGELCDGFHVHPFHSVKYLKETVLPNIETGLKKSGRERRDIALSSTIFVITGNTPDEIEAAKEPVRQQISFYASTRTYRKVLETHGWGDASDRLNELSRQGDWTAMANAITDDMLEVYAVIGKPDEIAQKVQARYEGLLERLSFYLPYSPIDNARWAPIVKVFNG
jgi:probable F420-dependent oxidoreductase